MKDSSEGDTNMTFPSTLLSGTVDDPGGKGPGGTKPKKAKKAAKKKASKK